MTGDTSKESTSSKILVAIFSNFFLFLLRSLFLAYRLGGDNLKYKRILAKPFFPAGLKQGIDSSAVKLFYFLVALSLIQVASVILFFYGFGVDGFGNPQNAIKNLITKQKIPKLGEIVNFYVLVAFFSTIAISNYFYWKLYASKKSPYQKMIAALKEANILNEDKKSSFWFYVGPNGGRLLRLTLVGSTGEEVVKREALWNSAGFEPTKDVVRIPGENTYLFPSAPQKLSSTMIYDRYEEWTALIGDKLKIYNWFLGEYVNRLAYKWKESFEYFTLAFIGQSGSGKTEAMKMWLTAFLCKNPNTRLVVCDLKKTGDWDVFAPLTENGYIVKSEEEAMLAISYMEDILNARIAHMASKGYKNIKTWMEKEKVDVPITLLIIDEFPQLKGPLKFDSYFTRDKAPANVLYKLYTTGRSFGLWTVLGSQFSGPDAISGEMRKNITTFVLLKTGSESESMTWINSPAAFRLGKGVFRNDGTEDSQRGYAYIDDEKEFVRFWYMDDWYIVHEFKKWGVATIDGKDHITPSTPGVPKDISERLNQLGGDTGGNRKKLSFYDHERLKNHEKAVKQFEKSYQEINAAWSKSGIQNKKPLALLWNQGETPEDYITRCRSTRNPNEAKEEGNIEKPSRGPMAGKPLQSNDEQDDAEFRKMLEERKKRRDAAKANVTAPSENKQK